MSQSLVLTVILNTNRRADALACLDSLFQSNYHNHDVIVLDNQSTDGSVEAINEMFPKVQVITLAENRGYGGNNNVGIKAALAQQADWIFVLNEDVILDPDCVGRMVEIGEIDERVGVVGPMVYHFDHPNFIQSAGGTLGHSWECLHLAVDEPDRGQFSVPHDVDWISGCGMLVRSSMIKQIGMIDDRYFYYWDETEWCLRAKRQGWRVVQVPQAKMWHKGVTLNHKPKPAVTYYATRNRLLTLAKHHAPLTVWTKSLAQLLRTLTSWSVKPRWRHKREHRDAMWRGMKDFLRGRWGQMPAGKQ